MTSLPHSDNLLVINDFIYLRDSQVHGKGIFASKDIPSNTKLLEYKGELISKEEGDRRRENTERLSKIDPTKGESYIMEVDENYDLDGDTEDNYAKYFNHSCDPNCEFTGEEKEVWVYSARDIKKDEELNCDYGFDFDPEDPDQPICKCGSKNCVGYIVQEEQRQKLLDYLKGVK